MSMSKLSLWPIEQVLPCTHSGQPVLKLKQSIETEYETILNIEHIFLKLELAFSGAGQIWCEIKNVQIPKTLRRLKYGDMGDS